MAKKVDYKNVLKVLEQLHKEYPNFGIGRHLATALADYGDFWDISDKELLFLLEKYKTELDLDQQNIASPDYVERVVRDAENFEDIYGDEEE